MNTKKLIDCDPRKTIFTGPSTVVVSLSSQDSFHKKIRNIFDTDQNQVIHTV